MTLRAEFFYLKNRLIGTEEVSSAFVTTPPPRPRACDLCSPLISIALCSQAAWMYQTARLQWVSRAACLALNTSRVIWMR